METKILLPKSCCKDELVMYIASRYKTSPLAIITQFMRHEGILPETDTAEDRNTTRERTTGANRLCWTMKTS